MKVQCTSIKELSKNIILMPKINFELLRTFILNFWCIHSIIGSFHFLVLIEDKVT